MTTRLEIHLLGSPCLLRDGQIAEIKGRKAWALLAYLLLSPAGHARRELAELLFGDADDPLRALRWNLTELRRALGTSDMLQGEFLSLQLPDASVDVHELATVAPEEGASSPGLGRDLLEGFEFRSSGSFEVWLLSQRHRVKLISQTLLRDCALARLAQRDEQGAIEVATRLVAMDPLAESSQALLIRCYAASGDHSAAARQLAAATALLHRELAVEPGKVLLDAIHGGMGPPLREPRGEAAARAQLDAGRAAIAGGVLEGGLQCFARAADEAAACDALELRAVALLERGSALAHRAPNRRHDEAMHSLLEAIALARRLGSRTIAGRACYEIAWVAFLESHYERVEYWASRALEFGGDETEVRAAVGAVRGKAYCEVGRYRTGVAILRVAESDAEATRDPFKITWVLSALGRALMLRGSLGEARPILERAVDVALRAGLVGFAPCPESYLGELYRLADETDRAESLLDHAITLARADMNITGEIMAARGRALVQADKSDPDVAIATMRDVIGRFDQDPEYNWSLVWALDGLCDILTRHRPQEALETIQRMEQLAIGHGMKELLARACLHRHALGDEEALGAAEIIGRDIDSQRLQQEISARRRAAPNARAPRAAT